MRALRLLAGLLLLALLPTPGAVAWWWEGDGRVAIYVYEEEASPAWGPLVHEFVANVAYTDVVLVSECSGPTQMRILRESDLAVIAEGYCDGSNVVADLVPDERYHLVAAVWGLCQPECLGQVFIQVRGVPG